MSNTPCLIGKEARDIIAKVLWAASERYGILITRIPSGKCKTAPEPKARAWMIGQLRRRLMRVGDEVIPWNDKQPGAVTLSQGRLGWICGGSDHTTIRKLEQRYVEARQKEPKEQRVSGTAGRVGEKDSGTVRPVCDNLGVGSDAS